MSRLRENVEQQQQTRTFFDLVQRQQSQNGNNKIPDKRVHQGFRIEQSVLLSLEYEAEKKGISLSNLVNKTLKNYVMCDMYFEELGFLLISKDFLRKMFRKLGDQEKTKVDLEEIGRDIGSTIVKEYVSYFFSEVNADTVIKFLDLWFKRFQSYQHRITPENNRLHYCIVNHDINMNFSIALKSLIEELLEPIIKKPIKFTSLTPCTITFSFEI